MAKIKNKINWEKIILGISVAILGIIVIAVISIFLWLQTWKTAYSSNGKMSIKYPPTGYLGPEKMTTIRDDTNHFFVTILEQQWKMPDNTPLPTEIAPTADESAYIEAKQFESFVEKIQIANHKAYLSKSNQLLFENFRIYIPDDIYLYSVGGRFLNSTNTKLNDSKIRTIVNDIIIELMIHTIQFH